MDTCMYACDHVWTYEECSSPCVRTVCILVMALSYMQKDVHYIKKLENESLLLLF